MKKTRIIFTACAWLVIGTCAGIAAPTDDVIQQLQQQGYSEIRMSKTWLGRARIVAKTRGHSREIVINPSTGEILRDLVDEGSTSIREVKQASSQSTNKNNENSGSNGDGNSGGNGNGNSGGNGNGNSGGNGNGNSGGNGNGNSGGNGNGNGKGG